MSRTFLLSFVMGFQLVSLSAFAMGKAKAQVNEISKIVRAEDDGSYSVCEGGFHFFFFSTPYSKASDDAQDHSVAAAKAKCENVMGGRFEDESSYTRPCNPIPGYFGACGFRCTAVTVGKCVVPESGKDARVADRGIYTPKRIKVDGREFLIDDHGTAHPIESSTEEPSEPVAHEAN